MIIEKTINNQSLLEKPQQYTMIDAAYFGVFISYIP